MPVEPTYPGVYVEEVPGQVRAIFGVATSVAGIVGTFAKGPVDEAVQIHSFADFEHQFGGLSLHHEAAYAVQQFFLNGGRQAWVVRVANHDGATAGHKAAAATLAIGKPGGDRFVTARARQLPNTPAVFTGRRADSSGIYAFDAVNDVIGMFLIPEAASLPSDGMRSVYTELIDYANARRAMAIVDVGPGVDSPEKMQAWLNGNGPLCSADSCVYFPRVLIADPQNNNALRSVAASGSVAGQWAATDAARGVWKAPAGDGARLVGVQRLATSLNNAQQDVLNALGINVLRTFPGLGNLIWGARTLVGADSLASEWKYLPVRRLILFLEESIYRGTQWVLFEPNNESLWSQIRHSIGAFLHGLFLQGAFQGATASEAYFVKCDAETTTQGDIDAGIVNTVVGVAPLKPAEFVIVTVRQLTRAASS